MTTATLTAIPSGVAGTKVTLATMKRLANQAKTQWPIRHLALCLVRHFRPKDYRAEAQAIFHYVRDAVRYVRDVDGVETIASPMQTIKTGQGDCDDKVTLLAALLLSIGHPVRFVAIGYLPGQYDHVFLETLVDNQWQAMESTEPWEFGERHKPPASRLVVPV